MLRWGLVPFWAKDPAIGNRLANARAETAAEKPAFREAFRQRRCLIPADGFYEWQVIAGSARKQPWFVRRRDEGVFALAGVWEHWRPPASAGLAAALETCAVLTMDPNALMAPIHARMPLIIAPGDYAEWLAPETPAERVRALVAPWAPGDWVAYRVGTRVNAVTNDDAGCTAPMDATSGDAA
jgi:putative SOS response-associated peptidase YedK